MQLRSAWDTLVGWKNRIVSWSIWQYKWARWIVLGIALVVVLLFAVWLLAVAWGAMSRGLRQILVLALIGLAALLWFLRGIPWLERRQIGRLRGDLLPGNPQDETLPRQAMQDALAEAKRVLARSPDAKGAADPLYSLPWFLVLSDEQLQAEAFLSAGTNNLMFPAAPRSKDPNQYWHWWFFKNMIAIEADARLVCDAGQTQPRGIWYQALQLLRVERKMLPLNGIVALVSADKLAGSEEELRRYALNLRRLVDECMEHLQLTLPLYIVVSGCERVSGFSSFTSALPSETLQQALGHRFDEKSANPAPWAQLVEIFAGLRGRLHTIRLAALRHEADEKRRKGIWEFTEALGKFEPSLTQFVQLLLEANKVQRTPYWRGLYFAAGGQSGAFTNDLFTRFIPLDQPLAARTKQPGVKRWLGSIVGVGLVVLLSALLARQVAQGVANNQRLQLLAASACTQLSVADRSLSALAECAKNITELEQLAEGGGLSWGAKDYSLDLAQKKTELVNEFKRIFGPYDFRLETDAANGDVSLDHALASAQRYELASRCARKARCRALPDELNHIFDPYSKLFSSIEVTSGTEAARQDEAADLLELYFAYLRWADEAFPGGNVIEAESKRAGDYLKAIAAVNKLSAQDVVAWGTPRSAALTVGSLWRLKDTVASKADQDEAAQVHSAHTRRTWEVVLAPALRQFDRATGDKQWSQQFAQQYFAAYFSDWSEFLASFYDQGIDHVNKDNATGYVDAAVNSDSPFVKLRKTVKEDLLSLPLDISVARRFKLLWGGMKHDWTRTFGLFGRFLSGSWRQVIGRHPIAVPDWLVVLRYCDETLWTSADRQLNWFYSKLKADETGAQSLKLANELFSSSGANPPEFELVHPSFQAPPQGLTSNYEPVLRPWEAVRGELRFVLSLIGYRALPGLDKEWQSIRAELAKDPNLDDPEASNAEAVNKLVTGALKNFVKEGKPAEVMDVALPLSSRFQALLREPGKPKAMDNSNAPMLLATIELLKPSSYGMVPEGPTGTSIEIECGDVQKTVSSKGGSRTERRQDIKAAPDACTEARIKVGLPRVFTPSEQADGADAEQTLSTDIVKSYEGEIFTQLAGDFRTGAKTFNLVDFRDSYTDEEWARLERQLKLMGINQARVFASVTLSKEMEQRLRPKPRGEALPQTIIE